MEPVALEDESEREEDHRPVISKKAAKKVIRSSAQSNESSASFEVMVKPYTTVINRLATAFSISLASKSFNAAEGAMARSEALEAAVLANGIFGRGERGREAYEIAKSQFPLEYKHWLVAFNDTMRNTSSVSMTNHAFIVAN